MDIEVFKVAVSVVTLGILIFGVAIPFGEMKGWKKSVDEKFVSVHGRIKGVEDDVKEIRGKM